MGEVSEGLIRVRKRSCLHPNCWCAWCKVCGEKLTHCDFTADDALEVARLSGHPCLQDDDGPDDGPRINIHEDQHGNRANQPEQERSLGRPVNPA